MIRINHKSKHFFVLVFCLALIGIIFVVGFLKYDKSAITGRMKNLVGNRKDITTNGSNDSDGRAGLIDSNRNGGRDMGIPVSPKENALVDKFNPVLDDNTPEENPNDVIEDPEME